jgi:mRNA interferase MazF
VVIAQGDIYWTDLQVPLGSALGYRRPVVVVQGDDFNNSRIRTAVCVLLTGNVQRARSPGNVLLTSRMTGLPRDSVANVSQIVSIDKTQLEESVGQLMPREIDLVLSGIELVIGREPRR